MDDKWKLEDIFKTEDTWHQAKEKLSCKIDGILKYRGKISKSSSQLLDCLEFQSGFWKEYMRLYSYANMRGDEDIRISKYTAMTRQLQYISTDFNSNSSFIEPEICSMDSKTVESYLAQESGLKVYRKYLTDLQRLKVHRLSEKEEALLAQAGLMASASSSIYRIFSNAELPFPEVVLKNGRRVILTKAGFALHRADRDAENREKVFKAFWQMFNSFKQTFAAQLGGSVNKEIFFARARNYDTVLESALDINKIPVEVYHNLIKNVNKNLHLFHRYLTVKKRLLGLEKIRYSDVYASAAKENLADYPYDKAVKLVLEATEPLGREYTGIVRKAVNERWIDIYPTPGKKSGAYSNGSVYDVHPYILLNYNGKYGDVSTLAHELGHTLHSYFSNKTQPYQTSHYPTFVAEVASTFNEILLIRKMLEESRSDDQKLHLLFKYLDGIKGTLFRQTQFAEFELAMYSKAEKGLPLTGDVLSELYGEILKKYYGHDKGICYIDDLYTVEWAYVPHFYSRYYVYQYATSYTASVSLAEKVLENRPAAVDRFIEFLSSGGSDYPIEILKKAGVDLTTSEPFQQTIKSMSRAMDEVEKILNKKAGRVNNYTDHD